MVDQTNESSGSSTEQSQVLQKKMKKKQTPKLMKHHFSILYYFSMPFNNLIGKSLIVWFRQSYHKVNRFAGLKHIGFWPLTLP